jgi:hypothetical protein
MKKVILTVSAFIFSLKLMAQAPEKMSYQAVVRNSSNGLVISAPVGMRISILQGSAAGASVYTETQTVNSNANGLVSLEIGSGTVVSGNFSTIDWSADTYFIQTETDPTGGTSYTVTGTSQLMSVPYALHAKSAETVINNDDADADPNNEIELPSGGNNGQVLNTDGSGNYTWVDQTLNTLPDGTVPGQTAYWDGTAWVVTTNLYNNGGNIGIGTTNPTTAKLVIEGNPGEMGLDLSSTDQYANMRVLRNPDGDNAMYIGLGSGPSSQSHFYTNDLEKLTLNGGVGVNNTNPTEALDVNGNIRVSGALMPNNTAGTAGQVLTSAGAGAAPTWTTPSASTNIYSTDGTLAGNRIVTQGANTLAFTGSAVNAFSVDGTTMSVDAANNRVGIGTAAPTNNLHVTTSTLGGGVTVSGPTPGYRLSPTAGATIAFGAANIANEWATGSATNDAVVVNQHATGKLILATGAAAAARMTITPAGNVGIGTTTPNAPLQFANTIANRKVVLWEDANNDNQFYGIGVNGSLMRYQTNGVNGHAFFAGVDAITSNELMRITGAGNVGIGTSTPVSQLSVGSASGTAVAQTNTALISGNNIETFGIQGSNGGTNLSFYKNGSATRQAAIQSEVSTNGSNLNFYTTTTAGVADQRRMTITANGNVGISTATPQGALHVNGANGAASWTYLQGNTGAGGASNPSASVTSGLITGWNATNVGGETEILFGTGAGTAPNLYFGKWDGTTKTQLMAINANGNVGIGTIAPTSKLQVVGLPVFADNAAATTGGLTVGAFYRTATGVLMVRF